MPEHIVKLYELVDMFPELTWRRIDEGTVATSRGKIQALKFIARRPKQGEILFKATTIVLPDHPNEPQPITVTIPDTIHIDPYDQDSWIGIISLLKKTLQK